jgi:hypothetical protein
LGYLSPFYSDIPTGLPSTQPTQTEIFFIDHVSGFKKKTRVGLFWFHINNMISKHTTFPVKNTSQNTASLFSHGISGPLTGKMFFHNESSGKASLLNVFFRVISGAPTG